MLSLDAGHQQMVTMWQQLHIDMKGLLSWQYLMKDITLIRSWNITMVSPLLTVMISALFGLWPESSNHQIFVVLRFKMKYYFKL